MSGGQQWGWVYDPHQVSKKKILEKIKNGVQRKGEELIELYLKDEYIGEPPKNREMNYVTDLSCKWVRNFFYFTAKYHCRSKYAISPFFNRHFARLGYQGPNKFKVGYLRHNDEWHDLYFNQSLKKSIDLIKEEDYFKI